MQISAAELTLPGKAERSPCRLISLISGHRVAGGVFCLACSKRGEDLCAECVRRRFELPTHGLGKLVPSSNGSEDLLRYYIRQRVTNSTILGRVLVLNRFEPTTTTVLYNSVGPVTSKVSFRESRLSGTILTSLWKRHLRTTISSGKGVITAGNSCGAGGPESGGRSAGIISILRFPWLAHTLWVCDSKCASRPRRADTYEAVSAPAARLFATCCFRTTSVA